MYSDVLRNLIAILVMILLQAGLTFPKAQEPVIGTKK